MHKYKMQKLTYFDTVWVDILTSIVIIWYIMFISRCTSRINRWAWANYKNKNLQIYLKVHLKYIRICSCTRLYAYSICVGVWVQFLSSWFANIVNVWIMVNPRKPTPKKGFFIKHIQNKFEIGMHLRSSMKFHFFW